MRYSAFPFLLFRLLKLCRTLPNEPNSTVESLILARQIVFICGDCSSLDFAFNDVIPRALADAVALARE